MWRYKCEHCFLVWGAPPSHVPEKCPACGSLYFVRVRY